jgi:hypothetical protein
MIIIPKEGKNVILIQEKQVEVAKLAAINIRKRKVPSFGCSKVNIEHKIVPTAHLFVLISDEEFNDKVELLQDNEIVLSGRENATAIGPLLALLRLHNHGHRAIVEPLR